MLNLLLLIGIIVGSYFLILNLGVVLGLIIIILLIPIRIKYRKTFIIGTILIVMFFLLYSTTIKKKIKYHYIKQPFLNNSCEKNNDSFFELEQLTVTALYDIISNNKPPEDLKIRNICSLSAEELITSKEDDFYFYSGAKKDNYEKRGIVIELGDLEEGYSTDISKVKEILELYQRSLEKLNIDYGTGNIVHKYYIDKDLFGGKCIPMRENKTILYLKN